MSETSFKETTMPVSVLESSPLKELKGFVRFVDPKGLTCGLFLASKSPEELEKLLDKIELSSPEFWEDLEESRRSGRVSSEEIEREVGLR